MLHVANGTQGPEEVEVCGHARHPEAVEVALCLLPASQAALTVPCWCETLWILWSQVLVPVGLGNKGNTCFFNSAVQALAHCPPFAQGLLPGRPASGGGAPSTKGPLEFALQQCLGHLHGESGANALHEACRSREQTQPQPQRLMLRRS